jgi:hypothetical protein
MRTSRQKPKRARIAEFGDNKAPRKEGEAKEEDGE